MKKIDNYLQNLSDDEKSLILDYFSLLTWPDRVYNNLDPKLKIIIS